MNTRRMNGLERMIRMAMLLALAICGNAMLACSIVYYVDPATGRIYIANNEDYWYDTNAYVRIMPRTGGEHARLWYGWDDFAQGGVNEFGFFFDGAATPEMPAAPGHAKPKGNLGDRILARCRTVDDALLLLEREHVALTQGHLFFGDTTGRAVVVEWMNGERKLTTIQDNVLMATNFLLADTTKGGHPCPRYEAMAQDITRLKAEGSVDMKRIGQVAAKAVQVPAADAKGRVGGTLYSTFIDLTAMQLTVVPRLDNGRRLDFDLRHEFAGTRRRTVSLK